MNFCATSVSCIIASTNIDLTCIKVTGYSLGRGPRSKRAISRSAQSHLTMATKDGAQTERHFVCIHSQKEWTTLYE